MEDYSFLRDFSYGVLLPPLFFITLLNNILVIILLYGPHKLRVNLIGPPTVQVYYIFLAIADIVALVPFLYFLLGS